MSQNGNAGFVQSASLWQRPATCFVQATTMTNIKTLGSFTMAPLSTDTIEGFLDRTTPDVAKRFPPIVMRPAA